MTDPIRVAEREPRKIEDYRADRLFLDAAELELLEEWDAREQRLQELGDLRVALLGLAEEMEVAGKLTWTAALRALSIPEAERCHYCGGDCDPAYPCKAGADVSAPEPEQERKS